MKVNNTQAFLVLACPSLVLFSSTANFFFFFDKVWTRLTMLSDVCVVEMANLFPGPFAGTILKGFGARVIKVEAPQGSKGADAFLRSARGDPEAVAAAKERVLFAVLNEVKDSVVIDVLLDDHREVLLRLLGQADVFIFGFRPAMLDQLGLSRNKLRARFPNLILCYISGYGVDGPLADRGGHDLNYLARAGVLGMARIEGPSAAPLPIQAADVAGGSYTAVMNILAALHFQRSSSSATGVDGLPGRGCVIDASMAASSHSLLMLSQAFAYGSPLPVENGQFMLCGSAPCYRLYRTQDGKYMAVGALEQKFWVRVVDALCLPPALKKPQIQLGMLSEEENKKVLDQIVAVFGTKTQAEWTALFDKIDAAVDPVLDPQTAGASPLLTHRAISRDTGDGQLFVARPPVCVVGLSKPQGPPVQVPLGSSTSKYFAKL